MDPSLSQALHLLNGDVTHNRIKQGRLIPTMMKTEGQTHGKTIENIYQRTLCRKPSDAEAKPLLAMLDKEEKPEEQTAILEDVFWALLNSKEFIFNH
jgi:hypothetical protein